MRTAVRFIASTRIDLYPSRTSRSFRDMPEEFDRGDYRTPEELAPAWGVKPDTVRSWVRQRLIPAVRIGRRLYIHKDVQRPRVERIEPTP